VSLPAEALEPHRRHVWGLCYRMTGSAAEADDLVQDTFLRALERPPPDRAQSLKPWLTKVALNLARDRLRRRRARSYVGPWLPEPVVTGEGPESVEAQLGALESTEGRYDLMESVSYAFLVALEALTPKQRAVLLLRDVFDYAEREAAEALDLTLSDVKVSLHRARGKLAAHDRGRAPQVALSERTRAALGALLFALGSQDYDQVASLVSAEAVAYSDGGGQFFAALRPVRGRRKVTALLLGLARHRPVSEAAPLTLNGLPALRLGFPAGRPRDAPEGVVRVDLDAEGKIHRLYTVLAPSKLSCIRAGGGGGAQTP
jgi:RNA polymerase sigma factor (sigma-70 family)